MGNPTMRCLVSYAKKSFSRQESLTISVFLCLSVLPVVDSEYVYNALIHKAFLPYPQLWIRLFISCRALQER